MEHLVIGDVEHPPTISPADVVRPLSESLGTTDVAINYFELVPGETFGFDYHRHLDQEELFVVLRGTATFRTDTGEISVTTGEAIRFAPGEFQLGRNVGHDRVVALAIGAPRESTEIEYRRDCPRCDESTIQTLEVDRDAAVISIECQRCDSTVETFRFGE